MKSIQPLPIAFRPLFEELIVLGTINLPREALFSAEQLKELSTYRTYAVEQKIRRTIQSCLSLRDGPAVPIGYQLPNNPNWAVDFNGRQKRILRQMGVLRRPAMLKEKTLKDLFAAPAVRRAADAIHLLRKIEMICFRCQTVTLDERLLLGGGLSPEDAGLLLRVVDSDAAQRITVSDVRFGERILAFAPKAKVLADAMSFIRQLAKNGSLDPVDNAMAIQFVMPLARDIEQAERMTVAAEIRAIASAAARKKIPRKATQAAELFALRYGVAGESEATLQMIGDRFTITRERVRQIADKLIATVHDRDVYAPALERIVGKVAALLPRPVNTIDEELSQDLGEKLSVEGVARFLVEVLRKPFPTDGMDWFPNIRREVSAMITTSGMAQMQFIYGRLITNEQRYIPYLSLVECLRALPGFAWIDEDRGWFWLGPQGDNRVMSHVRKVLAVAKRRLSIDEIYEGITRNRRTWSRGEFVRQAESFPPPYVLRDWLTSLSGIKSAQYNFLWAEPAINPAAILSPAEFAVFETLGERGGIASRLDLKKQLVDGRSKLGAMNFTIILDQAPFIRQLERGVYALRGWDLAVDRLREAKNEVGGQLQRQQAITSAPILGASVTGRVKFELELTSASLRNGAFVIPRAIHRGLSHGKYALPDGRTLNVGANYLTGIAPLARQLQWPAGTRLRLTLDSETKRAGIERVDLSSTFAPDGPRTGRE